MARIDQVLAGEKSWGAYVVDIIGHAGLGTAYALLPISLGVWMDIGTNWVLIATIVLVLFGGAARETAQFLGSDKPVSDKLHLLDRVLDTLHHLLGIPIAYGLVLLVRSFI